MHSSHQAAAIMSVLYSCRVALFESFGAAPQSCVQAQKPSTPSRHRAQRHQRTYLSRPGLHANAPLYVDIVRSSPVAHRRTFAFSVNPEKTKFFINDKVFEENR